MSSVSLIHYLHQIACDERGTAGPPGLAVNIHLLSALNVIQQKPDADDQLVLRRCRYHVRCAENQLPDTKLCPLLPPRTQHTNRHSCKISA